MQLLESILSFLVLLSLSLFLFVASDEKADNSLYLYELQGDAKNVIHLKNGFENITEGNEIAAQILGKTGLCIEMSETEITSGIVSGTRFSSPKMVPLLRMLSLSFNGTRQDLKGANLTGFARNGFFLGACANN